MLGEDVKKIKAVSCKLTILLRFESSWRLSILSRAACATAPSNGRLHDPCIRRTLRRHNEENVSRHPERM